MAASGMAFKLTYSDGHETEYDDNTKWEVENGVLKLGRESGKWTVFLSPSHWATLELVQAKDGDKGEDKDGEGKDKDDEGKDKDDKSEDKDEDNDEAEDEDNDKKKKDD